tara:strand:+ start:2873 stop:3058 length:186 start_codon:yes stop_codon:yes gene_type:complete
MLDRINIQKINDEMKCKPGNHTSYCRDYKEPYCEKTCDYANEIQKRLEKESMEDLRWNLKK